MEYKAIWFRKICRNIVEKYETQKPFNAPNDGPVWVCWWQGEEKMPPVVAACYRQLKKVVAGTRPLILIDENNYRQYVDIPEYVLEKSRNGQMCLAHFADVLRMCLLYRHGGLWVDSTVWVPEQWGTRFFATTYFSFATQYHSRFVSRSAYTCFFLGAAAGAPWIGAVRDCLLQYWERYNAALDYALLDFAAIMTYDALPHVRAEVQKGIVYAPHLHYLEQILNEPYDEGRYRELAEETPCFKLSHRIPWREYTEEGQLTFYGNLLRR